LEWGSILLWNDTWNVANAKVTWPHIVFLFDVEKIVSFKDCWDHHPFYTLYHVPMFEEAF
jgi:hypothetical protein